MARINFPVSEETYQSAKTMAARDGMRFGKWVERAVRRACGLSDLPGTTEVGVNVSDISIDSSFPVPLTKANSNGMSAALRAMKVGDSFVYPRGKAYGISAIAKRIGIRTCTRKIDEANARVWKTSDGLTRVSIPPARELRESGDL